MDKIDINKLYNMFDYLFNNSGEIKIDTVIDYFNENYELIKYSEIKISDLSSYFNFLKELLLSGKYIDNKFNNIKEFSIIGVLNNKFNLNVYDYKNNKDLCKEILNFINKSEYLSYYLDCELTTEPESSYNIRYTNYIKIIVKMTKDNSPISIFNILSNIKYRPHEFYIYLLVLYINIDINPNIERKFELLARDFAKYKRYFNKNTLENLFNNTSFIDKKEISIINELFEYCHSKNYISEKDLNYYSSILIEMTLN